MKGNPAGNRYHHGDLARELVAVAERLLIEKGAAALSLRETARIAGVSHAAPYRHFRDRAGLLAAIAARFRQRLAGAMQEAAANVTADPERQLVEAAAAYVTSALHYPAVFNLETEGVSRDGHPEADILGGIVARGVQSGVFRGRDVAELVRVVWSAIHGYARLALLESGQPNPKAAGMAVRTLVQHILYGISK